MVFKKLTTKYKVNLIMLESISLIELIISHFYRTTPVAKEGWFYIILTINEE